MTDPIGTAQERELIERLLAICPFLAAHHCSTDTITAAADALQSRIAEVTQFCAIMDKTDDEGFSPEIEQELMDLRAALSLQRRV